MCWRLPRASIRPFPLSIFPLPLLSLQPPLSPSTFFPAVAFSPPGASKRAATTHSCSQTTDLFLLELSRRVFWVGVSRLGSHAAAFHIFGPGRVGFSLFLKKIASFPISFRASRRACVAMDSRRQRSKMCSGRRGSANSVVGRVRRWILSLLPILPAPARAQGGGVSGPIQVPHRRRAYLNELNLRLPLSSLQRPQHCKEKFAKTRAGAVPKRAVEAVLWTRREFFLSIFSPPPNYGIHSRNGMY